MSTLEILPHLLYQSSQDDYLPVEESPRERTSSGESARNHLVRKLGIKTGERGDTPKPESKMPFVMWQFESSDVRLHAKTPVTIHVRFEGAFVFAENETLRVFAYGQSLAEALEQFQDHVVHFYGLYSSLSPDQVIGEGARLKQIFAESFQQC